MTARTATITKPLSGELKNEGERLEKLLQQWEEDIHPEMREDIYDPSYKDEEPPTHTPKLEEHHPHGPAAHGSPVQDHTGSLLQGLHLPLW